MEAHGTSAPRQAHASDSTTPRRITLGGHLFLCYDQRFDKYSVMVIDGHLLHLSTTTYRIFLALLERAVHPEPDAILPLDELLTVARLGPDEAAERRALRKRLYLLRSKIEAHGLDIACVQERHAAVGYVLRCTPRSAESSSPR